ncbi:MAG: class I SAM-dependent methyltransferase [Flavobacteriales bacterium]|nr:class I SAM-dependent methyltransferase [Flavobacteriales bacterium]
MKEDLNQYNEAYHQESGFYDENSWFLTRNAQHISSEIRKHGFQSLLSLGIGHHVVSDILSNELNHTVKKYDILEGSEVIISTFKIRNEYKDRLTVYHTYFENYEPKHGYDAIEMGFILEHVDDPLAIVKKYRQHLNPGGKMFVAVPNARSLHRLIGHEAGLLKDLYELGPFDLMQGHKHYFDLATITGLVEEAGLVINKRMGLFLKPITTGQMKQLGWGDNIVKALMTIGEQYPEIANCIMLEATLPKK